MACHFSHPSSPTFSLDQQIEIDEQTTTIREQDRDGTVRTFSAGGRSLSGEDPSAYFATIKGRGPAVEGFRISQADYNVLTGRPAATPV